MTPPREAAAAVTQMRHKTLLNYVMFAAGRCSSDVKWHWYEIKGEDNSSELFDAIQKSMCGCSVLYYSEQQHKTPERKSCKTLTDKTKDPRTNWQIFASKEIFDFPIQVKELQRMKINRAAWKYADTMSYHYEYNTSSNASHPLPVLNTNTLRLTIPEAPMKYVYYWNFIETYQ